MRRTEEVTATDTAGAEAKPSADRLLDARTAWAVAVVGTLWLVSLGFLVAGYVLKPAGYVFTGNAWYAEDGAQHEMWAREMWSHVWARNLLTPQPTDRSWFFSPLEWFYGGVRAITHLPYPVVTAMVGALCVIPLIIGLIELARRAGVARSRFCVVVAIVAGGFAPAVLALQNLGVIHINDSVLSQALSASSDSTPAAVGIGVHQLLILVTLLGLAWGVSNKRFGFPVAGLGFLAAAAVYPFYAPTLGLVIAGSLVAWHRRLGRRGVLRAAAWSVLPAAPALAYYALLPKIDPEFSSFESLNHLPTFSLKVLVVTFGLGLATLAGVPRLLRGTPVQQMLGVLALSVLFLLFVPQIPWRSHLLQFSPFLVIGAFAAWESMFDRLRGTRRHVAVAAIAGCLLLSATAAPYYFWKIGRVESQTQPPEFLSTGDDKAIAWLAGQPGSDTVLAPSDVSPWVAAWAAKRVVVGHFLWTHDFKANRQAVDAVYGGANPAPLIKKLGIRWIIVHTDARPRWAQGVAPVATFPGSAVLDASTILAG